MTRSESLIARVRAAAHEERNKTREATPLQVTALELAEEHEILVRLALQTERVIHDLTKAGYKGDGETFDQILKRRG